MAVTRNRGACANHTFRSPRASHPPRLSGAGTLAALMNLRQCGERLQLAAQLHRKAISKDPPLFCQGLVDVEGHCLSLHLGSEATVAASTLSLPLLNLRHVSAVGGRPPVT